MKKTSKLDRKLEKDTSKKKVTITTNREVVNILSYKEVRENKKGCKEAIKRIDSQIENLIAEKKKLQEFIKEYKEIGF